MLWVQKQSSPAFENNPAQDSKRPQLWISTEFSSGFEQNSALDSNRIHSGFEQNPLWIPTESSSESHQNPAQDSNKQLGIRAEFSSEIQLNSDLDLNRIQLWIQQNKPLDLNRIQLWFHTEYRSLFQALDTIRIQLQMPTESIS